MNNTMKLLVEKEDDGKRLDICLSKRINQFTRSNIKKIIESNNVKINKKITNFSSKKVKLNDEIEINFENKDNHSLLPSKIKLDVQYEDGDILIVNKPKGMVVHPGAGNNKNTLANALVYKYKKRLKYLLTFRRDKGARGSDQSHGNFIAHNNLISDTSFYSNESGPIATVFHLKKIIFNEKNELVNVNSEPYSVVHQYDKRWDKFQDNVLAIKKKFEVE